MILPRGQVALGILAGGRASRLGGADKAITLRGGERLVDRCVASLGAGYAQVMLSYNREAGLHLPAGMQVVADLRGDFAGPLAGIEALLEACSAPWLLSVPVDVDQFPTGLSECLAEAGAGRGARARDDDGLQPLLALWPVASAREVVSAALAAGEGAVHRVQDALGFATHEFAGWRCGNLNTRAELQS